MNAIIRHEQIEAATAFYCETCGGFPCVNPAFCEACRTADSWRGYKPPSVAEDLTMLAQRTAEMAEQWRQGIRPKASAVDRAYNFAIALGLHYRLAKDAREFMDDRPTLIIQRVLAAAFAAAGNA